MGSPRGTFCAGDGIERLYTVAMIRILASLVALLPLAVRADMSIAGWEKVGSKDGIETYRREVPGSPLLAIRGVADVNGSLLHVASVLMDTTRITEWMDRVVEARRIHMSNPLHYIEYERASVPFPLTDRDFVVESWVEVDAAHKRVLLRSRSTQHPSAPVTKLVRGEVISSAFTLYAIDAHRTRVMGEVHMDPKGSIPKWLVNLVQKGWAHTTITGLRRQVARVTGPDNPDLEDAMRKAGLIP